MKRRRFVSTQKAVEKRKISKRCTVCHQLFDTLKYTAQPYKKGGCCQECYIKIVFPARLNKMLKGEWT